MLDIIQKSGRFIGFQTDDGFLMDFRHIDQERGIAGDHLAFVIVSVEAPES